MPCGKAIAKDRIAPLSTAMPPESGWHMMPRKYSGNFQQFYVQEIGHYRNAGSASGAKGGVKETPGSVDPDDFL